MRILGASLLFTLAMAASAVAQQPSGSVWRPFALPNGCIMMIDAPFEDGMTVAWENECTPGVPLNSVGTLRIFLRDGRQVTMSGAFVAGVPNGTIQGLGYDASGAQIAQMTSTYNMGCREGRAGCTPYRPD